MKSIIKVLQNIFGQRGQIAGILYRPEEDIQTVLHQAVHYEMVAKCKNR